VIKPAVERRSSEALSTQLTDDCPVYHALSVHLRRAKLITHFDDRPIVATFLKSRVWGKVPEERTHVLEVPEFPRNTAWNRCKEASVPKTRWILTVVTTPACDGQTDGR